MAEAWSASGLGAQSLSRTGSIRAIPRTTYCRSPIEMSPFSPFEMSLSRVTDPPQRGRATPTSSAALLSAKVSNGEEGRARYPAHE